MAPSTERLTADLLQLVKALDHDLRFAIVTILRDREASPTELAEDLDTPLWKICEHVEILERDGFIELVDTDSRRGGKMHIYRATSQSFLSTNDSEGMSRSEREGITAPILQAHVFDLIRAVRAGTIDDRVDRPLIRQPGVLDDEGWKEMDQAAVRHMAKVDEIYERSANRLARSGEAGTNAACATFAFPMPRAQGGP